jgi:O-antigen ligase
LSASSHTGARLADVLRGRLSGSGRHLGVVAAVCLSLAAVSIAAGRAHFVQPGQQAFVLAGGFAALCLVALALFFYEATAVLGFALLGVARVEPAPPDLVFAMLIAVAAVTGRFRFDRLPSVVAALLGLFLTLNLVSFVDAVSTSAALRFFAITAYLVVLAAWLTGFARSHERVRSLVRAYVWAAIAMSAASSLALFVTFPGSELLLYPGGGRAQGLLKDPNVFGPFLVPALLIVTEEVFSSRLLAVRRWVSLLAFAVLALGILLSYSRAAWLNAAIAIAVLLAVLVLRRGGFRRAVGLLALVAAVGMLLVGVVAVTGSADFLEARTQFQEYDVDRFGVQRAGLALVAQHPFGIGPGQYDLLLSFGAHSLFVRALVEQGVLGLATILLLLAITLFLAVRNVGRGRDTYGLGSATLLAAWSGLIVNSVFVDTLHWRHLWIVAAFIWVGAGSAQARRR